MRNALNTVQEITKLIKKSSRHDKTMQRLKEEVGKKNHPKFKFSMWTVNADALYSIIQVSMTSDQPLLFPLLLLYLLFSVMCKSAHAHQYVMRGMKVYSQGSLLNCEEGLSQCGVHLT